MKNLSIRLTSRCQMIINGWIIRSIKAGCDKDLNNNKAALIFEDRSLIERSGKSDQILATYS
jgi:hypothetical protein